MNKKMTKSGLAVLLSRLEGFKEPKVREEQYLMDSEIAAFVLWNAYLLKDILQVLSSRNGLSYFVEEANIITETSVQPPLVLTHVPAPLPAPAPAPCGGCSRLGG